MKTVHVSRRNHRGVFTSYDVSLSELLSDLDVDSFYYALWLLIGQSYDAGDEDTGRVYELSSVNPVALALQAASELCDAGWLLDS